MGAQIKQGHASCGGWLRSQRVGLREITKYASHLFEFGLQIHGAEEKHTVRGITRRVEGDCHHIYLGLGLGLVLGYARVFDRVLLPQLRLNCSTQRVADCGAGGEQNYAPLGRESLFFFWIPLFLRQV